MAGWGTADLAAALPDDTAPPIEATEAGPKVDPQAYGWVERTAYDYDTYNKSSKELMDGQADVQAPTTDAHYGAVGGIAVGDWASNGAVYEWNDEYGEIGPRFEALELQLFGSDHHVKSGLEFSKIARLEVVQEGETRIAPVRKFEAAGLHPALLNSVQLAQYTVPTPIQQYTMPAVLTGHDVVAVAQTGSGKTAAYLIPILSRLMGKAKKLCAARPNPAKYDIGMAPLVRAEPLVLIVVPTRELATQVFDEARRFCYRTMLRPCCIYGGGPVVEQMAQLAKGCDLLIGTPGRLVDFIGRPHILTLKRLKYLVIDEADELLNNDWEQEMKQIMTGGDQEEGNITYLMFSATFPKMARQLAEQHLRTDHVRFRVGRAGSTHLNIRQDVVFIEASAKRTALMDLLMSQPPARTIIFVNSKRTCDEVDDFLFNGGIPCTSIHSDRTQREREDSIRAFRTGKAPVLIATGVSARGLDIANVMHVINYDMPSPQYGGIEEYTHRIGRTGRIGNVGVATSFYNDRDADLGETLVKFLLESKQGVPDFLAQYVPEGFVEDPNKPGFYSGDTNLLKFEMDSDDEGEIPTEENADAGGGWGAQPAAPAAAPDDSWGTPAPVVATAPTPATPADDSWGTAGATSGSGAW